MKSETEGQEAGLDSVSTETEDTPDDSSKHAHILDRVFRVSGNFKSVFFYLSILRHVSMKNSGDIAIVHIPNIHGATKAQITFERISLKAIRRNKCLIKLWEFKLSRSS